MPEVAPLRPDDPRRVGRYRLTSRVLGMTGDGEPPDVFLARRLDGDRVLVTFLGPGRAADPAARDRFAAEARTARRVAPFCAARILDADFEGAEPFLVTEYVPGPSLAEVVHDRGALPPRVVSALAVGTATGLAAIHQTGLVHGRFSPACVIMSAEGPRVAHVSVTPPYGSATPAADLLAWARTVLFAALGQPQAGPEDLARLPEDVRAAVALCLAPEPGARPSARSVLTHLLSRHNVTAGLLAEGARRARAAAPPERPGHAQRPPRRRAGPGRLRPGQTWPGKPRAAWWAAVGGVVAIVVAAGAVALAGPGRPSARPGPGSPALAKVPARFAGQWSGPVHQSDPVLTVGVSISLTAGASGGGISYPQLGCSGRLTVTGAAGQALSLRQTITDGRRNCEDGAITLASRPGGRISFTFARPGGASPTGILARRGR